MGWDHSLLYFLDEVDISVRIYMEFNSVRVVG